MQSFKAPVSGLAVDGNGIVQGGLRKADDVVISAPGVIVPRPGFGDVDGADPYVKSTTYVPESMHVFGGALVIVSKDSARRLENTTSTLTGEPDPPDASVMRTDWMEARKNLYYTTELGIWRFISAATDPDYSGVEAVGATGLGPLTDNTAATAGIPATDVGQVAWRFVFRAEDSNGYVRRSAPMDGPLGSASAALHGFDWAGAESFLYLPPWVQQNDQVELYRTRHSGSTSIAPSQEYYLQQTITVSATDVTNGYVVPEYDATPDNALGAALYTNPSQLGIENSKEVPPIASCAELWERCAWYANTTSKHRLFVKLLKVGGPTSARTEGIQARSTTGNWSVGSPNLTNVASVAGMRVGMYLADNANGPTGNGDWPVTARVQSISGSGPYTVVMTQNATANATGNPIYYGDVVEVGGVEFYAAIATQWLPGTTLYDLAERTFFVQDTADHYNAISGTALGLAFAVNVYACVNYPAYKIKATALGDPSNATGSAAGEIVFEEIDLGGPGFTVACDSQPEVFSPQLGALGIDSEVDVAPNRLYWSEPDEPEAVPIGQFVDVGSAADPILRLVALRGALLVFKTDGVFRVTGTAPDGWRVDLLDGTVRAMHGTLVTALDNRAYCWARDAVYEVTETGARSITAGLIDSKLAAPAALLLSAGNAASHWLHGWQGRRVLLLGTIDETWCWSGITRQWSRWAKSASCVAEDASSGALYWALPLDWRITKSREPGATYAGYDEFFELSGFTPTGTTVVITDAERGDWTPKACDWIGIGFGESGTAQHWRRVLSAAVGSGIYTLTIDEPFPAGTITYWIAYEGISSAVQWQAVVAGSPGVAGIWRELHYHLDLSRYASGGVGGTGLRVNVGASSSASATVVEAADDTIVRAALPGISARGNVPTEHARAHILAPHVELCEIGIEWALLGCTATFEATSERVRR